MDPMDWLEAKIQRRPRLWALYLRLNFCKGQLADGSPKPESTLFRAFSRIFYLDCSCCAALRGLAFGFVLGVAACLILT